VLAGPPTQHSMLRLRPSKTSVGMAAIKRMPTDRPIQQVSAVAPRLAERGPGWHSRGMNSSVALYEALTSAPDERTRARLIAEAFERLDERYPHLPDLVTQGHLRESELRLKREIEQLRGDLTREIEQLRGDVSRDIEQLRGDVCKEIEQLRGDIGKDMEQIRGGIARTKIDLLKWLVPILLGQVIAIAGLVKLL